jgi:hypothetical protein
MPDSDFYGPFKDYETALEDLLEENRDEVSFEDIKEKICK